MGVLHTARTMIFPLTTLRDTWAARWPEALALWSRFTKLREPRWCTTTQEERAEHLTGSFAMIRLDDHSVVISLRQVRELKLDEYALEILAHEIGHHVFTPGDLTDHARMIAYMRRALPSVENTANMVSNLYTDLLINDRLQRIARLRMADVYKALGRESSQKLWTLYMRMYELLWRLPRGSLIVAETDRRLEFDAQLGARVIRVHAKDWLAGAGRFAALCLPYLLEDKAQQAKKQFAPWLDTEGAGAGELPSGLTEIDDREETGAIHPAEDPALTGEDAAQPETSRDDGTGANKRGSIAPSKRYRDPIDYRELLKSLGVNISDAEATMRYYRERAMPHLVPFPERELSESKEPLPEGLEVWEFGKPLDDVDWLESVLVSPHVVPGVTTVQRTYGTMQGSEREKAPIDFYLGVDCSGSMVNPQHHMSWPVLGGAIMALSALRAGARVMVTLSGEPGSHLSTNGFVRNESEVLRVLTGYLGTGYTFGIPRLAEAFAKRKPAAPPAHIMILTDHDIFQMLQGGKVVGREGDGSGWKIAADALTKARGGGTYVLHMQESGNKAGVSRMRKDGWDVHSVTNWEELIAFARAFVKKNYARHAETAPAKTR